ncbi:RHS repeat domain-containing protein [Streptomyces sp. MS1.HAVA.3]|uniref:RHS repeat domain-containing protein n=1 Tax=Streptomyces caledonius TaxID=3134107 RepID=A0ABU8TY99_9ACTN
MAFQRNILGQLTCKQSADGRTTYEYDVFDELAAATAPDGTTLFR